VLSTNARGSRQHFRLAYSGTFFPGTPKFAGATIITLPAGQNEVADFKLDEKPMHPVSPVLETDAAKLGVVVYRLHNGYGSPFLEMREFELPGPCSGRFCLPDGSYRLTVDSYDSVAWDKARALDPRKQPDQLFGCSNFTVSRGLVADLNIHLLHESETPLTPVHIERQSTGLNVPKPGKLLTHAICCKGCDLAANAIGLFSADDFSADRGVAFRAADGTFAVQRLPPGRYWLHAVPICGYVARATSGGADLSSSPFVVGPDEHTPPIEITLRDDDATIRVERSWPKPMPRVGGKMESMFVYAVPQFKSFTGTRSCRMEDWYGEGCSIYNLPPGAYKLYVLAKNVDLEFRNEDAMREFESEFASKAQLIDLVPGDSQVLRIEGDIHQSDKFTRSK
jgi:hypothetical protein